MKTYQQTREIFHQIVRTSKKDSMFLYFILESNEGVCFYSTLEESLGNTFRDVAIYCSIEMKDTLLSLLDHMRKTIEIQVLKEEVILDSL